MGGDFNYRKKSIMRLLGKDMMQRKEQIQRPQMGTSLGGGEKQPVAWSAGTQKSRYQVRVGKSARAGAPVLWALVLVLVLGLS